MIKVMKLKYDDLSFNHKKNEKVKVDTSYYLYPEKVLCVKCSDHSFYMQSLKPIKPKKKL